MSTQMGPPPAGWYPDPEHDGRQRYWDGVRWTEHYAPGPPPTAPPPRPMAPPAPQAPATGASRTTLAVVLGLVALGVAGLIIAVAVLSGGSDDDGVKGDNGGSDADARAGAEAIAQAAEDFAGAYGYGPGVDDALPDGALAQFADPWPTNPFTDQPMVPGTAPGDYTFHTATSMGDGQEYLGYVDVVLGSGEIYSAPFEY